MDFDEAALRRIIREETRHALKDLGLADEDAGSDVRDLRDLISSWRDIRRTALKTISTWITLAVLGVLTLGMYSRFGGGGGGE
jgi:hypothetical protein